MNNKLLLITTLVRHWFYFCYFWIFDKKLSKLYRRKKKFLEMCQVTSPENQKRKMWKMSIRVSFLTVTIWVMRLEALLLSYLLESYSGMERQPWLPGAITFSSGWEPSNAAGKQIQRQWKHKFPTLFESLLQYMPGTLLRMLHILTHLLPLSIDTCTESKPILQMDNLRHRKIK